MYGETKREKTVRELVTKYKGGLAAIEHVARATLTAKPRTAKKTASKPTAKKTASKPTAKKTASKPRTAKKTASKPRTGGVPRDFLVVMEGGGTVRVRAVSKVRAMDEAQRLSGLKATADVKQAPRK